MKNLVAKCLALSAMAISMFSAAIAEAGARPSMAPEFHHNFSGAAYQIVTPIAAASTELNQTKSRIITSTPGQRPPENGPLASQHPIKSHSSGFKYNGAALMQEGPTLYKSIFNSHH